MELADRQAYLERMARPLREKLRIARYIPTGATAVLDVGCADGTVTRALATLVPGVQFLGIDLDAGFIDLAKGAAGGLANVRFERVYLRELLARPGRFDAVVFCSVLHEFYTYGEGVSSVLKALADAHELLRRGGRIIIRDMILHEYTKGATLGCERLRTAMEQVLEPRVIADFVRYFGPLDTLYTINHLLLKYWYQENWTRECPEFYVPVTFEEYTQVFRLLGMSLQALDSHLLPFLNQKWQTDFGFSDDDVADLRSTGILVAARE